MQHGSLLSTCHTSKEPDSVLSDVDVGQCIVSIAHCIMYNQYILVAASAAKCQEPCLCQATPNRGVLEQHVRLPLFVRACMCVYCTVGVHVYSVQSCYPTVRNKFYIQADAIETCAQSMMKPRDMSTTSE